MRDHYQVKFVVNGTTHYGLAESYTDRAKKAASEGLVIVEDAVLPVAYTVKETDIVDISLSGGDSELDKYVNAQYEAAQKADQAGTLLNALFAIGVADGSAWYVVTAVRGNKCDVEWRGFCPDRWRDHHFGLGCKNVPVSDVERYVGPARALRKMFSKQS